MTSPAPFGVQPTDGKNDGAGRVRELKDMKLRFLRILLFPIMFVSSLGAEEKSRDIELTLNAAYFTHNITFPFASLTFENPGVDFNFEWLRNRRKIVSLLLNSSLGWYYHDHFANAFYLDYAVGFRIKPKKFGLFFDLDIGAGYQLIFSPVVMYELNKNGEYVRDTVVSRSTAIFPVSMTLGWIFYKMKYPVSVFVKYKWFVQAPFIDQVPVIAHGTLHLGCGILFKSIPRKYERK